MYSEKTTIVDVIPEEHGGYVLTMKAGDLYEAAQSGDVLRRHDVSESAAAPEHKFVALSGVKHEVGGMYYFTFESGDTLEADTEDDYPSADSISDSVGGGTGGGVLVVTETVTEEGTNTIYTLDKTWQEINDADIAIIKNGSLRDIVKSATHEFDTYYVKFIVNSNLNLATDSADGYPTLTVSGK